MTQATIWVKPDIMLSEIKHKRTKTVRFHFLGVPRLVTFTEIEGWLPRSWAGGRGITNGQRVSAWEDEKLLELVLGMVSQ